MVLRCAAPVAKGEAMKDRASPAGNSSFVPLKYESLGRSVIPVGKAGDAKRPFLPWKQYQYRSPEPDDLLSWQEGFSPTNWAMVCGRVSGIVVLDCDSRTSCEWAKSAGLEPAVETPHGLHFYLSNEGRTISATTLELDGTRLEIKGEKSLANFYGPGYTVLERAVNPDGVYSLAELPQEFRTCLTHPRRTPRHQIDVTYEGERNTTLFRLASNMRGIGMTYESITAALCVENQAKCRPPLPDSEVRAIAGSVDRYEPGVSLPDVVKGLARTSLPASTMRVYSVVLDETINRSRVENWLAYSQLGAATGLPQNEVWRGLKRLKESRMVGVTKKGEQRLYKPTHPREWMT